MSLARSPKAVFALLLKLLVSVVLIVWLLRRLPLSSIVPLLGAADRHWVAAAALLLLGSHLLASYQWGRLLRVAGIDIPFYKVAAYYHVGLFFNNLLPANVAGDLARTLDAARSGSSRPAALSTVILDRLIGTVALGGIAVVTTLPAIDHYHLAAAYIGVVGFFAVSLALLRAVLEPQVLRWLDRLLARLGLARLSPALDDQRRLLLELFAVALTVQVMRIGVHVLFSRALGQHVETAYFFLFVPLLAVLVSLPISFNGIGVREAAGTQLFGIVGLAEPAALALQVGTYLVAFGVSLIGLLVFLARIPGRRAQSRNPRRSTE
ncbi:MAG: lysylphosphatidylglycerol synthase transmembrane domain-containing protein [Candidatus Eisenbacteria bacterium]